MTPDFPPPQDATPRHWVGKAHFEIQPFLRLMRLDRPIGIWLLVLPCYWSASLAALAAHKPLPNIWHLILFTLGAIVMRGAGCCWNDYLDRDIDAHVARTRFRPLASGQVTPRETLLFMTVLCLFGLVILLQFNAFTVVLGVMSLLLVAVYPSIKRVSDFPQIVLGLTFSWGALLGWSAAFGSIGLAPVMLYAAAIAWTIGYDTIYALQDVEDDALLGVGSTARRFGHYTKPFVAGCYVLSLLFVMAALYLASAGLGAFIGLAGFAGVLAYQVAGLVEKNPASALKMFKMNRLAGLALFLGLLVDGVSRFGF